jgi:hypothetical protein
MRLSSQNSAQSSGRLGSGSEARLLGIIGGLCLAELNWDRKLGWALELGWVGWVGGLAWLSRAELNWTGLIWAGLGYAGFAGGARRLGGLGWTTG